MTWWTILLSMGALLTFLAWWWHWLEDRNDRRQHERRREVWDRIREDELLPPEWRLD